MRYKGHKGKIVESRAGEIDLSRGHYYCEKCKEGIFFGSAVKAKQKTLE